jgi:hypothetical protein
MLKASTLEDRTRPATDGSDWMPARLRYNAWLNSLAQAKHGADQGSATTGALSHR